MGRASRRKHAETAETTETAETAETRIVLSPREFAEFHGVCAIAAMKVQAIQQQAAQQIAAAQQDRQKAFLRLVKKYRAQGMRPDQDYRFDEGTHSLVAAAPEA